MRKIHVGAGTKGGKGYTILIGRGMRPGLAKTIAKSAVASSYCIITDSGVRKVFGEKLLAQFRKAGYKACIISFPAGERSKSLGTVGKVMSRMLSMGIDRKSCAVALGGGVVGDIAGFCAAIYMRGIRYVQVPTTLLAMVDSSIGGKTGVDMPAAKNSVGAFLRPEAVYSCLEFLETLPVREIRNGLSETVKHAVISNPKLFSFIERNRKKLLSADPEPLERLVSQSCRVKVSFVARDEREENSRRALNYGHTIGHALEMLGNYREMSHGEAISAGMVVEAEMAVMLGMMRHGEAKRIKALLGKLGLPVKAPAYSARAILAAVSRDKKAVAGEVLYSLPERIGKMHTEKGVFGARVPKETAEAAIEVCR